MLTVSIASLGCDSADDEPTTARAIAPTEGIEPAFINLDPDKLPARLVERGQQIFRFETFSDERFWTDDLRMHEVIATMVSPNVAFSVGLKVDSEALPPGILDGADLDDPATTVALIGLDAVVGIKGTVVDGELVSVGVTCALCHSIVDDSVDPRGIGRRLDGYPNRDLQPGMILALSDFFDEEQKAVLRSWEPGFYDPRWNIDGINGPVLIPPAYGLAGVPVETYTGDGPISYWNAYVAITQMGGVGVFRDNRIGVAVVRTPDDVRRHLRPLLAYQLSLPAPTPPPGSFDPVAAAAGEVIFRGKGRCAECHTGDTFTDAGETLHAADETGVDPQYATRSATGLYRTTPLAGSFQHPPYFHDGQEPTLADVVDHYDGFLGLGLTSQEQADLTEYLKSL